MVFSIPIYRVSDVHAEKQQNARSAFPLTPSPPTTSSSSFSSSGRLIVEEECSSSLSKGSHYIDEYDQQQHYFSERQGKQPLKQSPSSPSSSYRYNKPRYYGSTMDHPDAAFLGVPKPSKSIGTSKSIHSISSIGSDASFKTAISTQQQKNSTKETAAHFVDDITMPSTPPHTTVSPNDNDEGLYLLWTHQLLRERGFKPSPCRYKEDNVQILAENDNDIMNDDNDDDDSDDTRSTDSSLTNGEDRESSLLLTSPDLVDYESRMRMYSSYNSCASSFAGPQQQDYFYQRPSTSSSMRHSSFASTSAAAAAVRYVESPTTTTVGDGEEANSTSFFASFFGACFSCNNGRH